jgi:hypothetical protein
VCMKRREALRLGIAAVAASAGPRALWPAMSQARVPQQSAAELPFERMAEHIVRALRPAHGERAILRYDPTVMSGLLTEVERELQSAEVVVQSLPYGPAEGFDARLAKADIYVWLPASRGPSGQTPPDQAAALVRWLDSGQGRQVHFHWADGTRDEDSAPGEHGPEYDRVYLEALEIDYAALDRRMDQAIAVLRSGEVRVTTREGTDLRFRLGDRPVCKQNGDASRERMQSARMRIDREIELPAGALRVAPLEESVKGRIAIPRLDLGGVTVRRIQLRVDKGVLRAISAGLGQEAFRRTITANPALRHFREFALGMNPKLIKPDGLRWIPYYGYGAGVVRLSLGDNEELGGAVRGGAVRWFFFPSTTVTVGNVTLVKDGALLG